jgi:ketopantoate hydroxymethyltransferase
MRSLIGKAAEAYAADVRAGRFPGQAELYAFKTSAP